MKFAKKGDYERAMRYYNKALEFEPTNHEAMIGRGVCMANQGQYENAIKEFEQALEIKSDDQNAIKFIEASKKKVTLTFHNYLFIITVDKETTRR